MKRRVWAVALSQTPKPQGCPQLYRRTDCRRPCSSQRLPDAKPPACPVSVVQNCFGASQLHRNRETELASQAQAPGQSNIGNAFLSKAAQEYVQSNLSLEPKCQRHQRLKKKT